MEAVTGVFTSKSNAERAAALLASTGIPEKQLALLTPQSLGHDKELAPTDATEQPGIGKAIGAVLGGSAGLTGGLALSFILPGVGPITALGLLGSAIATAAGATAGAAVGEKLEESTTEGLPEDEIFVYEDALRKGRTVIVAMAPDESAASRIRELLKVEGAESVDAAREQWWIGLRSAEQEHYSSLGKNFSQDEKFYRLGFESALHARTRCREYDQVLSEMSADIEDLEKQYPGVSLAEPFSRGYERGRDYYQALCDEAKAA